MKKKIQGGAKSHFLPKNTNFFQKLIFFLEKFVNQGGARAPLPPLGTPLGIAYLGLSFPRGLLVRSLLAFAFLFLQGSARVIFFIQGRVMFYPQFMH